MQSKLSDKYLAGFMDSDGWIGIRFRDNVPCIKIGWAQKQDQDKVMYLIAKTLNVSIRHYLYSGGMFMSSVELAGKEAVNVLKKFKKHLVIKRHYADVLLDFIETNKSKEYGYKKIEDIKLFKKWLKDERKKRSLPLPNFPTRKWMAGYLDGDGCISARLTKYGVANIKLDAACSNYDSEGIEILKKAFGGCIYQMSPTVKRWELHLCASKAKKVLSYCSEHMLVKKDQFDFVLDWAEKVGHFRDGINIKSALKQLKARSQRLSEIAMQEIIKTPKPIKTFICKCGSTKFYAKGECKNCYKRRWRKLCRSDSLAYA